MKKTCISDYLSHLFEKLGRIIARYPFCFIISSTVLSVLLSVGIFHLKTIDDMDYLILSDRGKVLKDKEFIENTFPMNTSEYYDIFRMTQRPRSAILFVQNKLGQNMLQKENLLEIQVLDKIIKNITAIVNGRVINYRDVCGIVNEKCFENPIIDAMPEMDDILSGKKKLKFPIDMDPVTYTYQIWMMNLGGVKYDNEGYVKEIEAMRLIYSIDESDLSKANWIKEWKKEFLSKVQNIKFHSIEVYPCSLLATELDLQPLSDEIVPLISVAVIIVTIFCIMTYTTNNWIRSKPWMGIAATVSAGLAITSSFGLMGACGIDNICYNITLPFLIFATEIDDAFVIIANWRITNVKDSVQERMAKTFSKSALSITITTLTNILSFCIAMTAEFPSVRIFCYYATACVCFTYFYQITFFGACLALSGYREERGLNAFTFTDVKEKSNEYKSKEENQFIFMNFFRDYVAEFISHPITKVSVIFLYIVNLGMGIWGVTFLREGVNLFALYPSYSKITKGYKINYEYFTEFTFPVQIVINKTLDYSKEEVQKSIESLMLKFQSHPNVAGSEFDVSWLKYYKEFQNHPISTFTMRGYDLTEKQDFIDGLRNVFLRIGAAKQFSYDIIFNHNYTEITHSRFFVMTKNVFHGKVEHKVINDLWEIEEEIELPVIVHSYFSPFVEQGIIIKRITLQIFWLTALLIFIVFIAFIPNVTCAITVAICIVSIIVETVGYMTFWNVNLDIISMMIIILCNGFCVNYPTHMCYAFITSPHSKTKEKLKESLYHVGFPILQGSISTILVLLVFLCKDVYIYTTFVKIVILISLQTLFHAVFVIPVILTIISYAFEKKNNGNNCSEKEYYIVGSIESAM
ncbi:patched domain-containing protein 3-like [Centruroides sculpturatus]|uniref:patched domain-containing protein 3-like n=1 Tax=Centruroides sculpturatus TaxID=218467 RepID=UPI000C6CA5AD|nr:patched domain-containing protein 3-like [Centruroides sculpturatus]